MVVSLEQLMGLPMVWLGVVLALLLIRHQALQWAQRRVAVTPSPLDDRAVALLARLYVPAGLLAGAYFSLQVVPLSDRWQDYAEKVLSALGLLLAVWVAWRGFSLLLYYWGQTNPNAKTLVPPVQLLARVFFAVLGVALVLGGLGYSLTKVWTALGIGSIAVALALQDTLTNTFAGFHLMMDQPIRVGDYIRLDSGEEGFVTQIGWRSTRLRTLPNNIVVIPNTKMSHAAITNYSMPESRLALNLPVAASYASDPRRVRAVLEELARQAVGEVEGLLADPPPVVRFSPGFGDYALNFSLICQARDFVAQQAVQDELRYRIFERFRREGIEIPFPARQLYVTQQEGPLPGTKWKQEDGRPEA